MTTPEVWPAISFRNGKPLTDWPEVQALIAKARDNALEEAAETLMNCSVDVPDDLYGEKLSAFLSGSSAAAWAAISSVRALKKGE